MLTIRKRHRFETETQEVLSTYTKRVIESGILNRDPGGPEHLYGREYRVRDFKQRPRRS